MLIIVNYQIKFIYVYYTYNIKKYQFSNKLKSIYNSFILTVLTKTSNQLTF